MKIKNTSNRQSRNQKRRFSRWMWGGVTISIILFAAVWGFSQNGGGGTQNSSTQNGRTDATKSSVSTNVEKAKPNKNESVNINSSVQSTQASPSEKMEPTFNQTVLDSLDPGWQLEKSQIIHFLDHDVIVVGIDKPPYHSSPKVIVVQFDRTSGRWLTKWSEDMNPDIFGHFQSVLVIQPNSEKMALALVTVQAGMSRNLGQALALTIDDKGTCTLAETLVTAPIISEQQGNALIVNGGRNIGMRKLSLQGKNYIDSKTPASQLSPSGSVQVAFILDNDGNVVATGQKILNMIVGQTIAFVPADARTKEEFDQGTIEIFTDGGGGNLATTNLNGIWYGNSFKLDKVGTVQFLLITDKKMDDPVTLYKTPTSLQVPDSKATFTVHVQP